MESRIATRQTEVFNRIAKKQGLTPREMALQPIMLVEIWIREECGSGVDSAAIRSGFEQYKKTVH